MAWTNILDSIYPVGSIYFSTLPTSPAETIGGTWMQVQAGTFLCSAGDEQSLQEGGNNTTTHTHEVLGNLYACITPNSQGAGRTYYRSYREAGTSYPASWSVISDGLQASTKQIYEGVFVQGNLPSEELDNRPQYLTVYMYYRTA